MLTDGAIPKKVITDVVTQKKPWNQNGHKKTVKMNLCLRILFIFAPIHISSESASVKTFCNKPADSGINSL